MNDDTPSAPCARPHLLVCDHPDRPAAVRSVEQARQLFATPPASRWWQMTLRQARQDAGQDPITPRCALPGRGDTHRVHVNADYQVVHAAGSRASRAAVAAMLTGDDAFAQAAWRQIQSLMDEADWPLWRDNAHSWQPADLRTGQLAHQLGLAYDWLHPMLDAGQRQQFVAGLDRRAIQPFFQSLRNDAGWARPQRRDNWVTCIFGGLGVLGMALAQDHPQAGELVRLARQRMTDYLSIYGPSGEFNESPAYAASTRAVVAFFSLLHSHGGQGDPQAWEILANHARWQLQLTLPPWRIVDFGDGHASSRPSAEMCGAIAAIRQDPLLQWFFLEHLARVPDAVIAMPPESWLSFDPALPAKPPEGGLPAARHFPAHGGVVVSRSDWDFNHSRCIVTGKAGGGKEPHGHDDAGQLCIDALGQRLIVDIGAPSLYPPDYFGVTGQNYHNVSVLGHNLLTIDHAQRRRDPDARARYLQADFDPDASRWTLDLTNLHDNARHLRRSVLHLMPDVVAVLDQAIALDDQPHTFSLRWHTGGEPVMDGQGNVQVTVGQSRLVGRILRLMPPDAPAQDDALSHRVGHHVYQPPFDRDRLGTPLEQRNEPYVESICQALGRVAILSLFHMQDSRESESSWEHFHHSSNPGWILAGHHHPIHAMWLETEGLFSIKTRI